MKCGRKIISNILALGLLLSCPALSSCSMGSIGSRSSSDTADSEILFRDTSLSDTEETARETTTKNILIDEAEPYMQVLLEGDVEKTCKQFNYTRDEVLCHRYSVDDLIYSFLFSSCIYNYGPAVTKDHLDYELDVTIILPDIWTCAGEVIKDDLFMYETAKPWILSLSSGENTDEQREMMLDTVLLEAMRRIKDGEFSGTVMYTDYFSFHDNIDYWVCSGTPSFVTLLGSYAEMNKMTYIDPISEYYLIDRCLVYLVAEGEISQEDADAILLSKQAEIGEML